MGNIQTNIGKIERAYWSHFEQMNELKAGGGGAALQSNATHWIEFNRKEAVKMGNRLFKLTGVYPDRFNEVKK